MDTKEKLELLATLLILGARLHSELKSQGSFTDDQLLDLVAQKSPATRAQAQAFLASLPS